MCIMMDGAIAQPYYVSEYSAEKVPFDDAVALEDFLFKGTKALMEDTIFYVEDNSENKLESLTVKSEAGQSQGNTKITVTPQKEKEIVTNTKWHLIQLCLHTTKFAQVDIQTGMVQMK